MLPPCDGCFGSRHDPQTELFVAERPIRNEPTVAASLRAIVFASWLNVLLVFIPVSAYSSFSPIQNDDSLTLNTATGGLGVAFHEAK